MAIDFRVDDDYNPWPAPLGKAAYHGIIGKYVAAIEPHTESDPAALVFQFVVYAGNCFGDRAWYTVENTRHYPNLYANVVGSTAAGRKGTAKNRINRLLSEAAPVWEAECIVSGLSSGEGLIACVRDPEYGPNKNGETELLHPGAKDKRLLAIEEEFSRPLRAMERANSTLPAVLRQAWDGSRLSIMTREDPIKATGAIVSIIGHITIPELLVELTEVSTANGFGNRFLWPLARRSKKLPYGGDDCSEVITQIAAELHQAFSNDRTGPMRHDEAARRLWHEIYDELTEEQDGLYGAMTARSAAQVCRIALIYALLDQQELIGVHHLQAGLELVRYSNDSVRHIFGDLSGNTIEDTILQALRLAKPGGMTRTQINNELFGRNVPAEKIGTALNSLQTKGKIHKVRDVSTGGRPAEMFAAV